MENTDNITFQITRLKEEKRIEKPIRALQLVVMFIAFENPLPLNNPFLTLR